MRCLDRFNSLIKNDSIFKHFLLVDKPSSHGENYFGPDPNDSLLWLDNIINSRLRNPNYSITLCRIFEQCESNRLIQHRLRDRIWLSRLEVNTFSSYQSLPINGSLAKYVFSRSNYCFD